MYCYPRVVCCADNFHPSTHPPARPPTHSITHSITSLPLEHKAPTNLLQPTRSWTSQPCLIRVFPAAFISSSTVLLQVPSGQPLFPGGVHLRAARGRLLLSVQRTWPSHRHRPCFTSLTRSIYHSQLAAYYKDSSKAPFFKTSESALYLLLVLRVSDVYISKTWTLGLCIFSFVLVWRVVDFQMLVSLLEACATMPIFMEFSFFSLHVKPLALLSTLLHRTPVVCIPC